MSERYMRTALGKPRKWKTVQLPEDLLNCVDEVIATPGLGYTSRSEFIKESVRLRITGLKEKDKNL
jgi:metal-responsive CopG/Arc/MetJ family transcriptional regulator